MIGKLSKHSLCEILFGSLSIKFHKTIENVYGLLVLCDCDIAKD